MLRLLRHASTELDDDAIKALARSDRRAGADALVRRYREPIFHHASWILKDQEEAIDVAQEVFIKAMREPRFFEPEFKMKAWLYRVTSNLCFNLVRDRRRRGAILEASPPREQTQADQLDRVFEGQQRAEVLAAIDQMSEDHKEILLLRYYDDMSYAEIAEVLQVALGTVMSRLSRARRRLADVLPAVPAP